MKKYKIKKTPIYTTEIKVDYIETKVPVWWLKFLRFIFDKEYELNEELLKKEIEDERKRAFCIATKVARDKKEFLITEKLKELGFGLKYNFPPVAREIKDGDMPSIMECNPNEVWKIVPIK